MYIPYNLTMIHLFLSCYLIQVITTSDQCGSPRIPGTLQFAIKGDNSEVRAPWIAALGIRVTGADEELKFLVTCSGVILTPGIVVTANHCLNGQNTLGPEYIRAGVTRIDQASAVPSCHINMNNLNLSKP